MERRTIVRSLRALRRRKRWSQRRLGVELGISQAEVSRRERGALERCTVSDVERWSIALGAHLSLDLRVDGERPLTDAAHAEMQNWLAGVLRGAGWIVEPEVSFNHYGDRGRIDVLAFHPWPRASSCVAEVKTRLLDAQDVIGRLDVKRRVAPIVAKQRGWSPATSIPALVSSRGAARPAEGWSRTRRCSRTTRFAGAQPSPGFGSRDSQSPAASSSLRCRGLGADRGLDPAGDLAAERGEGQ